MLLCLFVYYPKNRSSRSKDVFKNQGCVLKNTRTLVYEQHNLGFASTWILQKISANWLKLKADGCCFIVSPNCWKGATKQVLKCRNAQHLLPQEICIVVDYSQGVARKEMNPFVLKSWRRASIFCLFDNVYGSPI